MLHTLLNDSFLSGEVAARKYRLGHSPLNKLAREHHDRERIRDRPMMTSGVTFTEPGPMLSICTTLRCRRYSFLERILLGFSVRAYILVVTKYY